MGENRLGRSGAIATAATIALIAASIATTVALTVT